MKIKMMQMLVLVMICGIAHGVSQDLVAQVRQPLLEVMDGLGRNRLRPLLLLNDWGGLGVVTNAAFVNLSRVVTNRWNEVLAAMPEIATDQAERLVVMGAGVVVGEERYLGSVSAVADMVMSNKLTVTELQFYRTQCSIADHYAASSLARRFQEPAVSNLIMKLEAAGAYQQGVSHIFSGEGKELYLDAVHEGLVGPRGRHEQ